ncbi:MAG: uroporphyrinogen-III synthase [Gammaproteobacteria bacterium]|nr:uroporphyrinogen-III synthase [Gammaproteobacteria bacterium]
MRFESPERRLQDIGVLVTRPAPQAVALCRMLEAEGARAISFPTVTIGPAPDLVTLRDKLRAIEPIGLAIFVSPNAVEHGAALVRKLAIQPRIAAIGPSTAGALEAAGLRVNVRPALGYTSEDLLAEPALERIAGLRVAILRGGEGRELLAAELTSRGADVHAFDVYARRLPYVNEHDAAKLTARWRHREIDIIIATSVETLANLHKLLGRDATDFILRTPVVTSSERVGRAALRLGHRLPCLIAAGPDARSLVAALIDWRTRNAEKSDDRRKD